MRTGLLSSGGRTLLLAAALTVLLFWAGVTLILQDAATPRERVISGSIGTARRADYQRQLDGRVAPVRLPS